MKSSEYYLGYVCGFLLVLAVILLIRFILRKNHVKPRYDERQLAARGKAYKTGYLTLMGSMILCALLDSLGIEWCASLSVAVFTCLIVSVCAFAVMAIRSDAYYGFNDNGAYTLKITAFIGGINLLSLAVNLILDRETDFFLRDGLLAEGFTNVLISVMALVIIAATLIHRRKAEHSEESE